MPKAPRELTKQIEVIEGVIAKLNDLVDGSKIKVELYGKDFLEPLTEICQDGLALRSKLEIFKNNLETALTAQYFESSRFASVGRVIDSFLSSEGSIVASDD